MQNLLPAGLLDNNVEFFVDADLQAYKLKNGTRIAFDDFDNETMDVIRRNMWQYPEKVAELMLMGITNTHEMLRQYLICNYGGFDNKADMVDGQLQESEYWPCPKRGQCPHEGRLCDNLRTDTGEVLTRREIEVLKVVAKGKLDKEIADQLFISLGTVTTHTKNIRAKTGLYRKVDLARFATQKNLI
ncbi:hypothetical protein GCM10023149_31090 [Mucilaginibacter gynuensis]|uniref:HTH luxR-type domain-containing protein n=1 Tax=Mucilaginibacter gynuensis TaxID=1302236 RepID=A0ABP8GPC6_9SPHI